MKDGCQKARGKGKENPPKGSLGQTSLCWEKLVFSAEGRRFTAFIAAAHKATAASARSATVLWTSTAKGWAGRTSEHYLVPRRQA